MLQKQAADIDSNDSSSDWDDCLSPSAVDTLLSVFTDNSMTSRPSIKTEDPLSMRRIATDISPQVNNDNDDNIPASIFVPFDDDDDDDNNSNSFVDDTDLSVANSSEIDPLNDEPISTPSLGDLLTVAIGGEYKPSLGNHSNTTNGLLTSCHGMVSLSDDDATQSSFRNSLHDDVLSFDCGMTNYCLDDVPDCQSLDGNEGTLSKHFPIPMAVYNDTGVNHGDTETINDTELGLFGESSPWNLDMFPGQTDGCQTKYGSFQNWHHNIFRSE